MKFEHRTTSFKSRRNLILLVFSEKTLYRSAPFEAKLVKFDEAILLLLLIEPKSG